MSSDRAQRDLEALRVAFDERLATLEAALSDPARSESLEGLMLELLRVATEEAWASGSMARREADQRASEEIAAVRAAAESSMAQQYAVISDLRRALEEARARLFKLQQQLRGAPSDEWAAVRLSDRHVFREPPVVQINTHSGLLHDLSLDGCQLFSHAAVQPSQVVKVVLSSALTSLTCSGRVMWARLESRESGIAAGYRIGVLFTPHPDQPAIDAFIAECSASA